MAGGDPERTEVCEELDRLLLHLMSELETLQSKRQDFNDLVEQGWLSLSQARYAMGNKGVSSLQYAPQMIPLVHVCTSASEDGSCQFRVERTESTEPEDTDGPQPPRVEEIGAKDQVLRRRKGFAKTDEPTSPEVPPAEEAKITNTEKNEVLREEKRLAAPQDPLKWFGILVPQSLRRAQDSFRQGVALAGEVAALQSSIEATRTQYRALLKKKQQLLA